MEIKQLQRFVEVAEQGSISRAAEKLNISQPPLSMDIKALEEELGKALFERSSRGVILTFAGRMLYERAVPLLEMAARTAAEVSKGSEQVKILRLGVVSSAASLVAAKYATSLCQDNLEIKVQLYEGDTYTQLQQLRDGVTELAVVRTPFDESGFCSLVITTEDMYAVGKQDYFYLGQKNITPQELAHMPLVVYRRWENIIENMFAESSLTPYILCSNDDARTTLAWAQTGVGVGIVPYSGTRDLPGKMTAVKIDYKGLKSSIKLIWLKNKTLSDGAKMFLNCVTKDNKNMQKLPLINKNF